MFKAAAENVNREKFCTLKLDTKIKFL